MTRPVLYLPNGQPLVVAKSHLDEGAGLAVGTQPYRLGGLTGKLAKAVRKKGEWSDYYGMYRAHSLVRAAVDKVAKVATATGYDFVPRDSRATIRPRELSTLKKFFYGQHDFIGQLRRIYRDLLIYGDGYLEVVYDRAGRPTYLRRLAPYTILVEAKRNGEVVNYHQYDPNKPRSAADVVTFAPHELLHFKIDDPDNDIYGLSPLESLRNAVATDLFAQSYNENFFKNSAITGLILTVDSENPDEVDRNRKWLLENYVGPEASHAPIVLEGDVKIHKSVNSHNEMGFLEGRRFLFQEILAVLDVPPVKIGIVENANRANSREQDQTFRTESVDPLQYVVESVINDQFVRQILGVNETIFVHAESNARDAQEQMKLWVDAIQNGILNINEVRAELGKSEIAGGDINWVMSPTGAVPVVDLELYFKLPLINTDVIPEGAHGNDGHPGSGGSLVGPNPSTTGPNPGAAAGGAKSLPTAVGLHGVGVWLAKAADDDQALRQAFAYAWDAAQGSLDPRVRGVAEALERAVGAPSRALRQAYVERAELFVTEIRKTYEDMTAKRDAPMSDEDVGDEQLAA